MALRLRSKAFEAFGEIPKRYSGEGESLSPPLQWSGVPDGTREFVLLCEDPDAPTPKPFLHWLLYHLSANTTALSEGLCTNELIEYPVLATQGRNTLQKIGYTGPMPPPWHDAHHYYFRLFALSAELVVAPGAGREEVLRAMKGHILEETQLVGNYEHSLHRRAREVFSTHPALRPALMWLGGGLVSAGLVGLAAKRLGQQKAA